MRAPVLSVPITHACGWSAHISVHMEAGFESEFVCPCGATIPVEVREKGGRVVAYRGVDCRHIEEGWRELGSVERVDG